MPPGSRAKALSPCCHTQSRFPPVSPEKGKGTYHSSSRWRRGRSPGEALSPAQRSRKLGMGGATEKRERRAWFRCPHPALWAARPARAAKSNSYLEPRS